MLGGVQPLNSPRRRRRVGGAIGAKVKVDALLGGRGDEDRKARAGGFSTSVGRDDEIR